MNFFVKAINRLACACICSAVVLSSVSVTYAAPNDEKILAAAYNNMEKAEFKDLEYSWKAMDEINRPNITDGVLGGKIFDFDSDGDKELLVLRLKNYYNLSYKYISACLEMYEIEDNTAKLKAITDSDNFIDSITDAGGLECFYKNGYIALQCANQSNSFSDGANQSIMVYKYQNNEFIHAAYLVTGGSSIPVEYYIDTANSFKNIGFTGMYNYIGEDTNSYFSPYFVDPGNMDKSELNLAVLEKDIEKIYEILITNNKKALGTYDSNVWLNKMKMYINLYNYTNIEVPITVLLNGNEMSFNEDPYIENGTTMVPMRAIFEAFGAEVGYEAESRTITAVKDNTTVELVTDSTVAKINGVSQTLSVPVANKKGTTIIPLRFVSEALGAEVNWNSETRTVTINN